MRIRSAGMLIVTSLLVLSLHFSPLIVKAAEDELEGIEGAEQQFEDIHSKESTEEDITEPHLESTDQTEEKVESEVDESEEVQIGEETETTSNATEEEVVESDVEMSTFSVASDSHQPGDRNEQVLEMKLDLMKLGFGTHWSNPTNYFGPDTERVVREFQAYYGLTVNGRGDEATLAKIAEQLSSPFQEGKRSDQIQELKLDLMKLGFGTHWSNPTTLYGPDTVKVVRQFQGYYGLVVNGIVDEVTEKKIYEILASPYQEGKRSDQIQQLKFDLMQLGFGTHWSNPTTLYGPDTANVVRQFQRYYGLVVNGVMDEVTLKKMEEILTSPLRRGVTSEQVRKLKEDLMRLGYGLHWNNPTAFYGAETEEEVRKFQRDYNLPVSGIADAKTLEEIKKAVDRRVVKIFLDPGHGGSDSGAVSNGLKESDVVLDIARRTADVLRTQYSGVEVQLSRTGDTTVNLQDRANMANNWGADYFVSFHANAGGGRGFETYIHNGSVSNETRVRQRDIHNYLISRIGIHDRGMKSANFAVLRETKMPAILIEYMFIDNATERSLLSDPSYRRWLGQITAEAIASSYNLKKK
ncbi:peptidoglycan-binding protein [Halalkalibacterium halodurans]|uniref:peptidoglycan-binding protein n=1 Tax=Halalkalibacterium halodurans TaxID=86665 RepID=UPI002E2346EA|nr:peptidoglycan-binding protein [Halalkalibacterium halodurans]MED4107852.1 peptidoglycan-binding protein [Halalkalibacterium halodurans]MED4123032.1 peptidoglycan-binding protein [Halalkalibacterium halodurans]MED4148734.1 peptidoglycan-binding protein [Halalkalibacterium halodurans]MED4192073.1 peptidoglycan-binding protein [Halalkalibacterium halodurans]